MNEPIKLKTIDKLDAHDRLLELHKEADYISQGCQDCINNRPQEFGNHPFYIFAHKRELSFDERHSLWIQDLEQAFKNMNERRWTNFEEVPSTRLIWSPRLTKPSTQTNSMLFKAYPPGDTIKIIWMIPDPSLWDQYTQGKLAENKVVSESIYDFKNNKRKLEAKEDDDLSDFEINAIYDAISKNRHAK